MLTAENQEKILTALLKRPENQYCSDCNGKSPCCNNFYYRRGFFGFWSFCVYELFRSSPSFRPFNYKSTID